jgi:hypothetical protein
LQYSENPAKVLELLRYEQLGNPWEGTMNSCCKKSQQSWSMGFGVGIALAISVYLDHGGASIEDSPLLHLGVAVLKVIACAEFPIPGLCE